MSTPSTAQTKVVVIPLGETTAIPEPAVITYFSQSFVIRGLIIGGVNRYTGPGVQERNDVDINFMIVTTPGVVKKLFVYKQTAFETLTVRKNGVDTALATTLVTTNSGSNTADSFSVDTGDRISLIFFRRFHLERVLRLNF